MRIMIYILTILACTSRGIVGLSLPEDINRYAREYNEERAERERYVFSELLKDKSYLEAFNEIKMHYENDNLGIISLLVGAFEYKCVMHPTTNLDDWKYIEQTRDFLVKIAPDFEKLSFTQGDYEKGVKPFFCEYLFGAKTDDQIEQEIKEASSPMRKRAIFKCAFHCGKIKENFEEYMEKISLKKAV